jgi:hypothetical protein
MTGTLVLSGATPLRVTPGSPAAGKVLVSDASGNATWGAAGSVSAPLTLSSAQAAASILSLTNTTAAPTAPIDQMTAAAAGDSTIGVKVAGDTQQRLLADSNGALTWGSGSAVGDVTLSRTAVGVLGTNGAVQAGTVQGGSAASGTLTLSSTSNATKGKVLLGTSAYDEVANRFGVGKANPAVPLDVVGAAAISGTLTVGQSVAYGLNTYTANRAVTSADNIILMSAAAGSVTATLPTAVGIGGTVYTIKRTDATYANTVTVATTSSQTIDGATTYTQLWVQYAYVAVISDGANWQVIDASALSEPWQVVALPGQWTNRAAGFPLLQYRRLAAPNGFVAVVGDVIFTSNGTTGLTSGATITTLAAPYRPATEQKIGAWPGGGSGTLAANNELVLAVTTAGALKSFNVTTVVTNGTTQTIEIDGIFSLDA